ncbi:MAG: STAS domain-containing protein [Chitinispirillia bacterium]|nr:STAS domain-containing protein [Chitinispirillia bacterium]
MDVVKSQESGKITFAVTGRLDTNTAPEFQPVLLAALSEEKQVELDFKEVEYVSSAGLRVLLLGEKTAKTNNAALIIVNPSKEIKEVFDMTGFSDILKIV